MTRFDEIRAAHPELRFAIYALDPGGLVTLEVIDEADNGFTFTGETAGEALDRAFPPEAPTAPTEDRGVFD